MWKGILGQLKYSIFNRIIENTHHGNDNGSENTYHDTFVKYIECSTPRVNPNISYGLGMKKKK